MEAREPGNETDRCTVLSRELRSNPHLGTEALGGLSGRSKGLGPAPKLPLQNQQAIFIEIYSIWRKIWGAGEGGGGGRLS